jgi:hypothetical protein
MLETSRKYSLVFERVQREQRIADPIHAALFAKTLRNFAFKDARFDSRSKPLMKLLSALPLVISTLSKLCEEGDDDDRRWAKKMLKQFSGDAGYDRHAARKTRHLVSRMCTRINRNAAMQLGQAMVSSQCLRWQSCTNIPACSTRRKNHTSSSLGFRLCAGYFSWFVVRLILLDRVPHVFLGVCMSHLGWCACAPHVSWYACSPTLSIVLGALARPRHVLTLLLSELTNTVHNPKLDDALLFRRVPPVAIMDHHSSCLHHSANEASRDYKLHRCWVGGTASIHTQSRCKLGFPGDMRMYSNAHTSPHAID